jgi:hypothetical protein
LTTAPMKKLLLYRKVINNTTTTYVLMCMRLIKTMHFFTSGSITVFLIWSTGVLGDFQG